ncbi:MAG: hypothetical protein ACFE7E_07415 [Candidatus Hodarchaeota archaeon]
MESEQLQEFFCVLDNIQRGRVKVTWDSGSIKLSLSENEALKEILKPFVHVLETITGGRVIALSKEGEREIYIPLKA